MAEIEVVETFLGASARALSGITDMEAVSVGGALRLYTTTRMGGAFLALTVGNRISLLDQEVLGTTSVLPAPSKVSMLALGNKAVALLTGGSASKMSGYVIADDGSIGAIIKVTGGVSGVVAAQAVVESEGKTYCYFNRMGEARLQVYQLLTNGRMQFIDETFSQGGFQGVDVTALEPVTIGARSYLLALSSGSDALRAFRVESDGGLTPVSTLGAEGGMGIAAPSAIEIVGFDGKKYALVTAAGSSSISVVELGAGAQMVLADHVVDTRDTRFAGVQAFATAQIGDRVFILAGGGDGGVTLFTLLPGGRLLQLAQKLQTADLALDNITAMKAVVINGMIEVFVAGEGAGIIRLRIDPGELHAMLLGGTGADTRIGGAGNDLIDGRGGNDTLNGGVGDDILVDGAGNDDLSGGAGADIFVMAGDGSPDTIRDFQIGVDRLDLSAWGRIYDISALSISTRPWGMLLKYKAETLTIHSASGAPIPVSAMTSSELFGLWHVWGPPVIAGARLEGSSGAETLVGSVGDDTIAGSRGADYLDGGGGFDTVDYHAATSALRVDLEMNSRNAGYAAGSRLINIEALIGGSGNDTLSGHGAANLLRGGLGNDLLEGRGGDDTLIGGAGEDVLDGGRGADRLLGGAGRDAASYASATAGVQADLSNSDKNTGDAKGDIYVEVENLYGSRHSDRLCGDNAANILQGYGGSDVINGRNGDDALFGGDGDDWLSGDAGNDTLNGGAGIDWAAFSGKSPASVDLGKTIRQNTGLGWDVLTGIENLRMGDGNDRIIGNASANHLMAGGGNDSIYGGAGNDTLDGGLGNDRLDGGAGYDMIAFAGRTPVRVNLALTTAQNTGQGMDSFISIENLIGSDSADILTGNTSGNQLFGGGGNDWIAGGAGNDRLYGGDGNDQLFGNDGDDWLYGGAGQDWVSFDAGRAVQADLRLTQAQNTGWGRDTFDSIENINGSSFGDSLIGNAYDNELNGGVGTDYLNGDGGNDILNGGSGKDTLVGGTGNDDFIGGTGFDTASFAGKTRVKVDLSAKGWHDTGHGRDRFTSIEALKSGGGKDRLTGTDTRNTLDGGGNRDVLHGGGGKDILLGGRGNDKLFGEADRDRLDGGRGNDKLIGGAGADSFVFGTGKDTIKDFKRYEHDRILLDDSDLPKIRGLSPQKIINLFGHDRGDDLVFNFGNGHKLVVEDAATFFNLAHHIHII